MRKGSRTASLENVHEYSQANTLPSLFISCESCQSFLFFYSFWLVVLFQRFPYSGQALPKWPETWSISIFECPSGKSVKRGLFSALYSALALSFEHKKRRVFYCPSLAVFKTQLSRNRGNLLYVLGESYFEQEVGRDAFQRFFPKKDFFKVLCSDGSRHQLCSGLEEKPVVLAGEGTSFCRNRTGIHWFIWTVL